MFQPPGIDAPRKKPPRSMGLLLFLSLMLALASLLLVYDLRTGPNPFQGYVEAVAPRPQPKDGPVEVMFLDEDDLDEDVLDEDGALPGDEPGADEAPGGEPPSTDDAAGG